MRPGVTVRSFTFGPSKIFQSVPSRWIGESSGA